MGQRQSIATSTKLVNQQVTLPTVCCNYQFYVKSGLKGNE